MPKKPSRGGKLAITASYENARWFNNVVKHQVQTLAERVAKASNDMEARYYAGMRETLERQVSDILGVTQEQARGLIEGRIGLKSLPKPEPRPNRKPVEQPHRTFVNSYGEATTRYITSSTYERAQKRLMKQVESIMGLK